jgi:uncharacterized protein YbjT (DUF2867 family)
MRVILFGATGMVGQGALRECLLDAHVERVLVVGRSPGGVTHRRLHELVLKDFLNFSSVEAELTGYDACFFCLGVSAVGMTEAVYRRVTYDIATAVGETLSRLNPGMTFVFVSGAGADSTGRGSVMWARVKGETENALLRLPFKAVYVVRPAFIQPRHGITSRTRLYRMLYAIAAPLYPVLKGLAPGYVTTTELVGRAMLNLVERGWPIHVLENRDINLAAR